MASYAAITPLVSDGEQHAGKGVASDLFGRHDALIVSGCILTRKPKRASKVRASEK